MSGKRICLVSPGHLASNPRLVKEADALSEAGYEVRVVAGDFTPAVRRLDETVLARAAWRADRIGLGSRPVYVARRLRQELAKRGAAAGVSNMGTAVWAHSPVWLTLARAAAAEPAELYVAHNLSALPAAAWAARRHGAKLGFDAEDDHLGELGEPSEHQREIEVRRRIEQHFLPLCDHLTAASPGIARAYRERYGVEMTPILNVFPLAEAPGEQQAAGNGSLSVYWFSQTIGHGRGLEPFIEAMGKTDVRLRLVIRGSDFLGFSARLRECAREAGRADKVEFLPSAPPEDMARLAAQHDIGLSLEPNSRPNNAVCLGNKIFTYLLAGVPVLLSNTPAQRDLAVELGAAAQVVNLNNPSEIVRAVEHWSKNAEMLAAARREAWRLGRTRFNWDVEKRLFLQLIERALI